MSSWLPVAKNNQIGDQSKMEKEVGERNRVTGYSKIEGEKKDTNENTVDISFFYSETIKLNWQKKKNESPNPQVNKEKQLLIGERSAIQTV